MGKGFVDEVAGVGHAKEEILGGGVEAEEFEVAGRGDDACELGVVPLRGGFIVYGEDGEDVILL